MPAPGATADTVAVSVTDWPNTAGVALNVTTVLVLSGVTVTAEAADVDVLSFVSPE